MLHLSRKAGQSVIINDDIKVTIKEVSGKTVKLSFEFPASTVVLREELHLKIQQQNIEAAKSGSFLFESDDFFAK